MSVVEDWEDKIAAKLVGRTIARVRYMTPEECDEFGWLDSAVMITLDDGTVILPSSDDEGNEAGSLMVGSDDLPLIPTMLN